MTEEPVRKRGFHNPANRYNGPPVREGKASRGPNVKKRTPEQISALILRAARATNATTELDPAGIARYDWMLEANEPHVRARGARIKQMMEMLDQISHPMSTIGDIAGGLTYDGTPSLVSLGKVVPVLIYHPIKSIEPNIFHTRANGHSYRFVQVTSGELLLSERAVVVFVPKDG